MTNLDYSAIAELSLSGELIDRPTAMSILAAPDLVMLEQLAAAYRVRHHYWSNRSGCISCSMPKVVCVLKIVTTVPNLKSPQPKLKNIL
jgi:hypothetical protein